MKFTDLEFVLAARDFIRQLGVRFFPCHIAHKPLCVAPVEGDLELLKILPLTLTWIMMIKVRTVTVIFGNG